MGNPVDTAGFRDVDEHDAELLQTRYFGCHFLLLLNERKRKQQVTITTLSQKILKLQKNQDLCHKYIAYYYCRC